MRLLLTRHGETVFNRGGRYSGQREIPLTALGEAQHTLLRRRLAGESIERVVCSDLTRCVTIAALVAADHRRQAEPDRALRELGFGAWEGLTYAEASARDPVLMAAFDDDPAHVTPPGGESLTTVAARMSARLEVLLREHDHVGRTGALLLVGHSGSLRALLCTLLGIPLARYWMLRLDPASLTVLDIYPASPIVSVLNDTCHLYDAEDRG